LQQDLADKTRYIAVLERRLLQARRSSHSRASIGFSGGVKAGIMVGEDHGVAAILKEKDDEIADLRARLDDKDHMLTALRSAARSRDTADRSAEPLSSPRSDRRTSTIMEVDPPKRSLSLSKTRKGAKSVDEVSRMLDEMIQDRVESGELVKSSKGSVRLPSERKREVPAEAIAEMEPLHTTVSGGESPSSAAMALQA